MNTGLLIFLMCSLLGLGLLVAGVFVLLGTGSALLAGGGALLVIAGFIRKGLTSD